MYDIDRAKKCLRGLIGWKNHYDKNEISNLPYELTESQTGEHFNVGKHPALRLDLIKATLPNNRSLVKYLRDVEDGAISQVLSDLSESKELAKTSKTIVANDIIYNSEGWSNDVVLNESRFVGVSFRVMFQIGLKAVINRLALQFSSTQKNLKLYLYHSTKSKAIAVIKYTTIEAGSFEWIDVQQDLHADESNLSGGIFYLGYYQDDIKGQAIQYKKLNWKNGYCNTCDGGVAQARYTSVSKYVQMQPFYVPNHSLPLDYNYIFDPAGIIEVNDNNFGFNFNISINCDLTNFWCDNRKTLKNVMYLKVLYNILKDMQYSQQINHVEEQLKMMIIRDLEGDKETNYINIVQQYNQAIKTIKFNHSSISKVCLPCDKKSGLSYGVI